MEARYLLGFHILLMNHIYISGRDKMKHYCKRLLFVGLLIGVLMLASPVLAEGADSELDYDNYIAITVSPDGSIIMTLQGDQSYSYSPWEVQSGIKELDLMIDFNVEDDDRTSFESEFNIQLDPSVYSQLANLDLDLVAHSDETVTNITALVDYPGYLGVDGSLGFVIVEPPFGFILDLMLEAKLYYTIYPQEELQMLTAMIPMLETQLSAMIMEASDGNIIMENFELLDYEEGLEYASFTVSMRLSGDLQEGLTSAFEEYGAEITPPEISEELPALSIESIDYHVTFSGDNLMLEADIGGAVTGDFNEELNKLKDAALEDALESDEIDADGRALIQSAQPIDLHVQHLVIESTSMYGDESAGSTLSVESLGLEPSSFEALMVFLEALSYSGDFEVFNLVFEGESSNNQFVSFTVPAETKEPILLEEQMVVWSMEDIDNLDEVTYEVNTNQMETTTIITAAAIGLAVVGAAFYVLKNI